MDMELQDDGLAEHELSADGATENGRALEDVMQDDWASLPPVNHTLCDQVSSSHCRCLPHRQKGLDGPPGYPQPAPHNPPAISIIARRTDRIQHYIRERTVTRNGRDGPEP